MDVSHIPNMISNRKFLMFSSGKQTQMEDFRSFCQTYVIGFGPGAILFSASSSPFFCNQNVGNRSGCTEDSFLRKLILGTGWSGY